MNRKTSLFALCAVFLFGGIVSAGPLRDFFERMKARRHPAPSATASAPAKPKLMKPAKPAPACPSCPLPPKK